MNWLYGTGSAIGTGAGSPPVTGTWYTVVLDAFWTR